MKRLKISGETQNISYIENYYNRYQIEDEEHRFFLKEIFDFQLVNKINEVDLESFSTASKYNQNYFLTIPSFFIQDENGEQKSIKGITSNKLES